MDLVIDANILFAALIKDSVTAALILDEHLHLFTPEYLFEEFKHNQREILEKTHRTEREFNDILGIMEARITIIPAEKFTNFLSKAHALMPEHTKDAPYFALALMLRCPVWSNEKVLKGQDTVMVYSTHDILQLIRH